MSGGTTAGRAAVGHFEIPARDPERAARFYRQAFGWRVERRDWEGGPYYAIRGPEAVASAPTSSVGIPGGLTTPEVLGADRPLVVVHVEGAPLADWLARIEAAGGRIEGPPQEVAGQGRFTRFRDPEGNLLGLWAIEP